jgi:excisionase family DNA binding protein
MRQFFEFAYWIHGTNGDGPDGRMHDAAGLIAMMRTDPEYAEHERSFCEFRWREARRETVALIEILIGTARYMSDLIGWDVPVLAPRDVINASLGINGKNDAQALLMGKAMNRAIQKEVRDGMAGISDSHLAEIERMLQGVMNNTAPIHSKWMTTDQVAVRLQLNRATVERKFRRGEILGDKTSGNQWRTTEDQLRRSPYLTGKRGKRRAQLE